MTIDSSRLGLDRFVQAQDRVYASVCAELSAGRKTSHWMWFIFPQLRELGRSPIAKHFGIASRDEALAYWQHPVLGQRLTECTALILAARDRNAHEILGSPDDLKFCSCMTLFSQVVPDEVLFTRALKRFFGGYPDEKTLQLLRSL